MPARCQLTGRLCSRAGGDQQMINVANEGNQDSLRRMVSISGNDDDQPEICAKGTAQKKNPPPKRNRVDPSGLNGLTAEGCR